MQGSQGPQRNQVGASPKAQHKVRLPGFVIKEDTGLGQVIKRATSLVGIRQCGGCAQRAIRLDNWMTFTR